MSFATRSDSLLVEQQDSDKRFSLLLLEPGEIYFEDFSAIYYPFGLSEATAFKRKQRGRLKLCSKSILFDPEDVGQPILKLNFRDVKSLGQWAGSLLSKLDTRGKVLSVRSTQVIEMKEGNMIAPYKFSRINKEYLFSLTYVGLDDVLPRMHQLYKALTLGCFDQRAMISSIVKARQAMVSFNASWLESLYEKIAVETTGDRVTPLVQNPGQIVLTTAFLYFQPFNKEPEIVLKVKLSSMGQIVKRRYLLRQVGIEIFYGDSSNLLLVLPTTSERDHLYDELISQPEVQLQDTGQEHMTLKWQNGVISNYDYLMYLNSMADRSFNDLTQYPVFPWIICDLESKELDLQNPKIFRDLSKPIGALNPERLARYKARYRDMPEPKFLYGSHYSTPGYVLFYLVRIVPEYLLCLHNGRFDHPDRMFNSVMDTWENCLNGAADVKELIPEFYQPPGDFLLNKLNLNLGMKQDRSKVHHVALPPWAKDPDDMTRKLREALECSYVSERLHHWIDLIFGYKQRGPEAVKACNVFYHLTYEGTVDLDSISDPNEKASLENQILEFGQTPKQLFTHPHPRRNTASTRGATTKGLSLTSEPSVDSTDDGAALDTDSPLISEAYSVSKDSENSSWQHLANLKLCCEQRAHKESVTAVAFSHDGQTVFSVAQDTTLKILSLTNLQQLRSVSFSPLALSSCTVMPDSRTLVLGSWDNNIYIYSVEFGHVLESVLVHDDAVSSVHWQNDLLLTSSWDTCVKVWRYKPEDGGKKGPSPQFLAELEHETEVNCVNIDTSSKYAVSGTVDGALIIWNLEDQTMLSQHSVHSGKVNAACFSPDGQRVLSAGADNYLKVLDVNTGTEIYSKSAGEGLQCAAWNGDIVLAGDNSGNLHVWNLVEVQPIAILRGHKGAVTCFAVSPNGMHVVTGGEDKKVVLWSVA
ncbi:protein FAN-like [Corticium candelabrum]|uniref:protein FAN-like n=1 Tax=Corticium candelabrum TaxID=121492 RepID=UPI002E258C8E|nr:protein FAN-like [Corticium candelabrum]